MYAYSTVVSPLEQTAQEAFAIAWNFLSQTEDIEDASVAQGYVATEIMRLLERGERHRIRLANLAIRSFQQTSPAEREARLGFAHIA
jgi:hypothetical protein